MRTLAFITSLLLCSLLPAQTVKWFMQFGGTGYDYGYCVKQTLDGHYIITGSTSSYGQGNSDVYLVKLDSMGIVIWDKAIGNYNNDVGQSVIQLSDSSYVVAGYTNSQGMGGYDIFLVKTDKNGNTIWTKTYGGSDWDFAYSLQPTADGGIIVAGTTYSQGYGSADGYVMKLDTAGTVLWSKTYGGKKDDEFKSIVATSDGGYALCGYTKSYTDSLGDAWVFKLDVLGDSVWSRSYGGGKWDYANALYELQNTKLLAAGGTRSHSPTANFETEIQDFDLAAGIPGLQYIDASTQDEYYNGITQGRNGNIVGCGTTHNVSTDYDGLVDMYNSGYGYVNFFSIGSLEQEEFFFISPTRDKGYVAVGKTNGYNAVLENVFVLKMDSLGAYGPNATGIFDAKSQESLKVSLYPNPSSGKVYVRTPDLNHESLLIEMTDVSGQVVLRSTMEDVQQKELDLSLFENGVYFIRIDTKDQRSGYSGKIVLIR